MPTDDNPQDSMTKGAEEFDDSIQDEDGRNPFPIVAVGASAGGLEAFQQLLAHLPPETGMAFVFVQHLAPGHESHLTEILSRSTSMPVLEAAHDKTVEPNHVYIIPPNRNLGIARGRLQVTERTDAHRPHLSIDFLFRSLAEEQKSRAIGVVLSGNGSDGTQGLCEIKAVGGITFAQDEASAAHRGMPLSALHSGCADFVLPPPEIAGRLAEIGRHPYLVPKPDPAIRPVDVDADAYRRILTRVRAVSKVDFSLYRDTTINRRIMRRMVLHADRSLEEYSARLDRDEAEARALYEDLLINVTSFFRDPEVFEALKQRVYPDIVRDKPAPAPIRVWVAGCSTGQEAYSIALSLVEFFDHKPVRPPIQIFATDLSDPAVLEKARAGLYPESIEGEVSAERLRRFFVKEGHMYRISKSIRDLCVFARQNVTADPPFSHVDLISCRNLLIYLNPQLQKRVVPLLHYALNAPGFLVLGSAETVGNHTDLFELVDGTNKIYRRKPTASRPPAPFAADEFRVNVASARDNPRSASHSATAIDFQREADRILLGRYAPAGVLVNENLDIIQFRGRTSPYLESPPGEPTTSLLKMAREGLFLELRNSCAEAIREKKPVRRDRVRLRSDGGVHEIRLEVIPVRLPGVNDACLLVIFHEAEADDPGIMRSQTSSDEEPVNASPVGSDDLEEENLQLRKELAATKEYLQAMIEQQDAANEELRSANEEILSSNEELQSTNEELETAKEELQSTNEELSTVNEQLHSRNTELDQITNDLTNLLTSSGIPAVMVGPDLRVRRFTAAARTGLNLLPSDIGRPITDLKPPVEIPDLEKLIAEVIDQVQVRKREIRDREGRFNLLRIHPYRTMDNKIDGAVILLLDVDELKRAQEALAESQSQLRMALEAGSAGTLHHDLITGKLVWDDLANVIFNLPANVECSYDNFIDLIHHDDRKRFLDAVERAIDTRERYLEEIRVVRPSGDTAWVLVQGQASYTSSNEPIQLSGVCIDITERKRMASELEELVAQLRESDRRKDEFLATLAHELRNPLAPMSNAVQILRSPAVTASQADWCRDVIGREVHQMARLLDDLLDVSRITRNALHFRSEWVDLRRILENALEEVQPLIDEKGLQLRLKPPDEVVQLHGDPVRLTQVFSNILHNAAKYTDPGGEIVCNTGVEGGFLSVSVKDSGIGIAPEILPRIFEIFVQADTPGMSIHGGLGLGLTLAKRLVEMHRGTIEAKSEGRGKGSEFIVRLPIVSPEAKLDEAASRRRFDDVSAMRTRRILVVDDREAQAKSLSILLESKGHQVRVARDGTSALDTAAGFIPEVALVDIGLPDMSGYEVARRLRGQPQFKSMLLIAQTGWGREQDQQRSREAGFDYHMAKPLDTENLIRLISEWPLERER